MQPLRSRGFDLPVCGRYITGSPSIACNERIGSSFETSLCTGARDPKPVRGHEAVQTRGNHSRVGARGTQRPMQIYRASLPPPRHERIIEDEQARVELPGATTFFLDVFCAYVVVNNCKSFTGSRRLNLGFILKMPGESGTFMQYTCKFRRAINPVNHFRM